MHIVYKKKKIAEIRIIGEFLKLQGYRVLRVIPGENPDAKIVIEKNRERVRIGIEHTEFHVDAPYGTSSPGRSIHKFWRLIQSSIRRRVSHRPALKHTTGLVVLKREKPPNKSVARDLAKELIDLALENPLTSDDELTINRFPKRYTGINEYVSKVILSGTGSALNISWECVNSSVSSIGISANEIAVIIEKKAGKFPSFSWDNVQERWLLISASGCTVFNLATAHPERVNWESLQGKCAQYSANIERIFFWDRSFNWYKEICPGAPLIQNEWRVKSDRN